MILYISYRVRSESATWGPRGPGPDTYNLIYILYRRPMGPGQGSGRIEPGDPIGLVILINILDTSGPSPPGSLYGSGRGPRTDYPRGSGIGTLGGTGGTQIVSGSGVGFDNSIAQYRLYSLLFVKWG